LAVHDASSRELRIGEQEAIGGHELNSWGVGPASKKFAQNARGGRFSYGNGTCNSDDKRCAGTPLAQKAAGRCVQPFGSDRVQAEELAERKVDLGDFSRVEKVTNALQPRQFLWAKRLLRRW